MSDHKKFMKEAIKLASQNATDNQGGPFGAIVVKDGEIVGRGVNKVTSSNDPTAHAEVVAIRDAAKNLDTFNLEGCEIYSSCEPCPMCLGAIYWARPRKLYFAASRDDAAKAGFDDAEIYNEIELPFKNRKLPTEQFSQSDAVELFKTWVNIESKIEY